MYRKLLTVVATLMCFITGAVAVSHADETKGPSKTPGQQMGVQSDGQPGPHDQAQSNAQAEKRKVMEEAKKIIVAKVNGVDITMDEVLAMMNRIAPSKGKEGAPGMEAVKKKAVDRLILQELAYQKAKADGLIVEQKKIDASITNFEQNVGGEEGYRKFLESEGLKEEDLRAQVERSLLLELIYAQEVLAKAPIPEDKVKEEYEKTKDKFLKPEKISVIDVFVLKKGEEAEMMKKATELLAKIRDEKKHDPWKLVLDGTFIVRNHTISDAERDKELREAALKLKQGELSEVVKAADGLHIMKLKEHEPQRPFTYDEAKGSIEDKFRMEAREARLKEWEAELKKNAKIELVETKTGAETPQEKKDSQK